MLVSEITEFLVEKQVESSWLYDISYSRKKKTIRMVIRKPTQISSYDILNVSRHVFDKWHRANSKGKFFHSFIKGFYDIKRVS